MLKLATLTVVLASAVATMSIAPASAAGRTTPAQCMAIYNQSLNDPQSYRVNRDAYISCLNDLG